jgi:hypothetical protein
MLKVCIAALALVAAAPVFAEDWHDILVDGARRTDERNARLDQSLHNRIMEGHAFREELSRDDANRTQERILDQLEFDSVNRTYRPY